MESQRRRMIWFEITKRRLLNQQQDTNEENTTPSLDTKVSSSGKWDDDEENYVSQR